MDMLDFVKREHERTIDLISKLSKTSSTSTKRRERLCEQLREQLDFDERALEEHIIPVLEGSEDVSSSGTETARKASERIRQVSSEIDALPDDEKEYARKLKELKRQLQEGFRAEEREVLRPLVRALDDEAAKDLVQRLRETKKEPAAEGDEEFETQLAYARAGVRELSDRIGQVAETTQVGQQQLAESVTKQGEHALQSLQSAARSYNEVTRDLMDKVQILARIPIAAGQTLPEAGTMWSEWLGEAARGNASFAQELLTCRDLSSLAQSQQRFVEESMRRLLESNIRWFQISRRAAMQALEPLEQTMGDKKHGRRR